MPTPEPITRIIIRRGTETERSGVLLLQSEPGFAVDSKRLYIGDGTTYGGIPIGTKFLGFIGFGAIASNVPATNAPAVNDIVFDNTSNILYALTAADYSLVQNYRPIGINIQGDNVTIEKTGISLAVKRESLDCTYLTSTAIGRGLERINSSQTVQVIAPQAELSFTTTGSLQITPAGVTNAKLAVMPPNTVKGVLSIAGTPQDITLDQVVPVDDATIEKVGGVLQVKNAGITNTKLAPMAGATVKGRLTTAGEPQDIPIASILQYQDFYFSLDVRGLNTTGSGSGSVAALLNELAPPGNFPAGLQAHIASTVQNYQPAVYTSYRQISRTVTVLVTPEGLANPTRNNNLLYRVNTARTSWEYVSG